MSWFSSRATNAGSRSSEQATPALKQKHKQIESLRDQFTTVSEVKRDESYRLEITIEGKNIVLDINLPPRFPLVGPTVTVFPPVRHPWVNDQMVVDGSPLVKNFSTHSNLGRAIQQVVKEFTDHPPQFIHSQSLPMAHPPQPISMPVPHTHTAGAGSLSTGSMYYNHQPAVSGAVQNGGFAPYPYANSVPPTGGGVVPSLETHNTRRPAPPPPRPPKSSTAAAKKYQPPPVPDTFDDIKTMSTEELNSYLGETEGLVLVDRYVAELPLTKKLQEDRNNLFHENEAQASVNLAHEPELEELWTELQDRCLQIESLKSEYEKKISQQRQLLERYDIRGVTSKMKTLAQEAETQSEIIAEDFLDNKMSVKDFLQTYKRERVRHHLRKIKHENLSYGRGRT